MSSDVPNNTGALPGVTPTRVTGQILGLAVKAGLRPAPKPAYRGVVEVHLNGLSWESAFGVIHIGIRSGRVLRATIRYGTDGETKTLKGAVAVRRALRELL